MEEDGEKNKEKEQVRGRSITALLFFVLIIKGRADSCVDLGAYLIVVLWESHRSARRFWRLRPRCPSTAPSERKEEKEEGDE